MIRWLFIGKAFLALLTMSTSTKEKRKKEQDKGKGESCQAARDWKQKQRLETMTGQVARLQVADTGREDSYKRERKKLILQSKPTKSYQFINRPCLWRRRESEERLGTQASTQKPASLQWKGPSGDTPGGVHGAELYPVMSCVMTFQSKRDHIYNIGLMCL